MTKARGLVRSLLASSLAAAAVTVAATTSGAGPVDLTSTVPPPTYQANDYSGGNAFAVLPPGANGLVDALQAAQFEAEGTRPPDSQDQLGMYESLLYDASGLSDSQLPDYFTDESFGIPPGQVTRVEHPSTTEPVTIYRDAHDIPHVYGATDAAAAFGIGYAQAEDRLFMMDVLRHYGEGTLSQFLGPSCAFEQMDHDELLSAPYTRAQVDAQLAALGAEGPMGQRLVSMLSSYVDGINAYIRAVVTDPLKLPADYAAAALGPPQPWQTSDVVYIAALIGGIFGRGGGGEVSNAALLQYLQGQLGTSAGTQAFGEFKEQNDPGAPTTITDQSFPYEIPGTIDPATTALPDHAGAPLVGGPEDTTPDCDLTKPNISGLADAVALLGLPRQMSNAIVVDAAHSATGHPLAVMGPQVGYFAPQILMQEDVHAPDYQAEGASFPGTGLVELGRGEDYAWSATSAGTDNVDQRLELICDPAGGAPGAQGTSYVFDGKCLPMTHEVFTEVGVPKPGGQGGPAVIVHDVYLTVHGVVQGWTTADGGRPVAVVDQRSTFDHELDSGIGFLEFADPGVVSDPSSWMRAAQDIDYTFNWFYVDDQHIAYYVSGLDPVRPGDVDPNLPSWGTGIAEWQGFLPPDQHPHEIDPPQGYFVSWNNKPAPGFSAADDDYSMGPVHRQVNIVTALRAQLAAKGGKLHLSNVVTAMETAAKTDLDGLQVLPELLDYLSTSGITLGPGVQAMVSQLQTWLSPGHGPYRVKASPADAQYEDAAAVAIMDELEPRLTRALFDPIFAAGGVASYDNTSMAYDVFPMELYDPPNKEGAKQGDAYGGGWEGYVQKLLDQLQGIAVPQPFTSAVTDAVCGPGGMGSGACAGAIAGALQATFDAMVAANGGSTDPATWVNATANATAGQTMPAFDSITSETIGLVGQPQMDWQNRPTFQQVISFTSHR